MPTTIAEAFAAVDLVRESVVRWKKLTTYNLGGVYIISLTQSLNTFDGKLIEAPLAAVEFQHWRDACPELTLDGKPPSDQQLMDRIRRFWIPDEVILYIGLAGKSLSRRLDQYYGTQIGAPGPHSGGLLPQAAIEPRPTLGPLRPVPRFQVRGV